MTRDQNHVLITAFERRKMAVSAHILNVAFSFIAFSLNWFDHSFFNIFRSREEKKSSAALTVKGS